MKKNKKTLILHLKTTLAFRENVTSEVLSTPLLNSVSTSSSSDYSFPAEGDTPAQSFDNYYHEMFCLLQSLPMDNVTLEQTDTVTDTLINKNVKNQSVSDIDFDVFNNSRNISTKGISSAGLTITDKGRLKEIFFSDTVFNLSHKVFTKTKIKVLERGLDFAPTQKCRVVEFCRMQVKWHFRNEITKYFSTTPAFRSKSKWTLPLGHPNSEMFLSELEKELFKDSNFSHCHQQNFSWGEWQVLKDLARDKSIVIKSADKESYVVIWDKEDYLIRRLVDNLKITKL